MGERSTEAKNENDEPQNVVAAFDQLIMPYWRQTHDASFPTRFVSALLKMLAGDLSIDRARAIYIAHDWVWYYRFCQDKQRKQPQGPYGDLFDRIWAVRRGAQAPVESHKAELVADTRWAGAAWNSPDGMWTPLMRSAVMVRDTLGGPDFVPANI